MGRVTIAHDDFTKKVMNALNKGMDIWLIPKRRPLTNIHTFIYIYTFLKIGLFDYIKI